MASFVWNFQLPALLGSCFYLTEELLKLSVNFLCCCMFRETFYDPRAYSGFLESYIRNKRSRDPEMTTACTHSKG